MLLIDEHEHRLGPLPEPSGEGERIGQDEQESAHVDEQQEQGDENDDLIGFHAWVFYPENERGKTG